MIVSRVPQLLAAKFGSKDKINLTQIQLETKLPYTSVSTWAKGKVSRIDLPVLMVWCKYLDCTPGDILVLERSGE